MRYITGFRNADAARHFRSGIAELGRALAESGRQINIMEVCGSHTMAIARYGIKEFLPDTVNLISGPGCPVCVTDAGYIDTAIALARQGTTIVTFGDLLRVPGSDSSLAECRSEGCSVEICYSPSTAVDLAAGRPGDEFAFLAIGFETTVAPVVSIVDVCTRRKLGNITLLTAFKLVPPALGALMADPEIKIDAFLCPAHVSAIIGADAYESFAGDNGVPCVIAGFEPLDILMGIEGILEQIVRNEARVDNQYSRVVSASGNRKAQELMSTHLQTVDASWRGIGMLPASGLSLSREYARFDAELRHSIPVLQGTHDPRCACGDIIKGKRTPAECAIFGRACTPDHPVGPCMVSTEGTCAAHFQYCS